MNRNEFDRRVEHRSTFFYPFLACIRNKGRYHGVAGKNKEDAVENLWDYMNKYIFNKENNAKDM